MHVMLAISRYFQDIRGYVITLATTGGKKVRKHLIDLKRFPVSPTKKHLSSFELAIKCSWFIHDLIYVVLLYLTIKK